MIVPDRSGNTPVDPSNDLALSSDAVIALNGIRLLHMSDSFAAQQQGSDGQGIWVGPYGFGKAMEAYSRGKFRCDYDNISGVMGETSSDMLERFDRDITARKNFFDVCVIDTGRNEQAETKLDGDTSVTNIINLIKKVRNLGKECWVVTPNIPRTFGPLSANNQKVRGYVNRQVMKYCRENNVRYIDLYPSLVDPTVTTGAFAPGLSDDTLHVNTAGGRMMGKAGVAQAGSKYPDAYRNQQVWDLYDSALNPYGNALNLAGAGVPQLLGTTGTRNNAIPGVLADNLTISCFSGTAANCTLSKLAPTAQMDSDGGEAQVFTFTTTAGAWLGEVVGGFNTTADLVGKQYELELEYEVTSWVGSMPQLSLYLRPGVGGVKSQGLGFKAYATAERLFMRSAPGKFGNLNEFFQFAIGVSVPNNTSGVFKVVNACLRILG